MTSRRKDRDFAERRREEFFLSEVEEDSAGIRLIGMGAAVVMIFGLGFAAGGAGKARAEHEVGKGADMVAAADASSDALAMIRKDIKLTFHQTLRESPLDEEPELAEGGAEKSGDSGNSSHASPAPVATQGAIPAPAPEGAGPPKSAAPPSEATRPAPAVEGPSDEERSDRLAAALNKVLGKSAPTAVKALVPQEPGHLQTSTGSAFAVQVAAFPEEKSANKMVAELKAKGHPAQVVWSEIPGKGPIYRVRLHGFSTREDAEAYRGTFSTKEKLPAIVLAQTAENPDDK
jgi:cell division septation protein DedD